jgi:hypothetical protein
MVRPTREPGAMNKQDVRSLTAEELDLVAGGVMETTFQYGNFKMEIWASASDYGVCTYVDGQQTGCVLVEKF